MNNSKKIFSIVLLLVLVFVPTRSASAKGFLDGQIVFGSTFTLKSGDTLDGDLVVLGGMADIEEDAVVKGSVVVIGGEVDVAGEITRDVVVIGGRISLGEKSIVEGDLVKIGGSLDRSPGSLVKGEIINNIPAMPFIHIPNVPNVPKFPVEPTVRWPFDPLGKVLGLFFRSALIGALAMLVIMFLQVQVERVARAIVRQPLITGSVGLLTMLFTPVVTIVLVVTIILIPVAIIAVILLTLAWIFGVIALGLEVGQRFTRMINQEWPLVLTVGFGTFLLLLVVGAIDLVPCIGLLGHFMVAMVGIGGVVLTIFGSRPYPPLVVIPPAVTVSDESKV
jgi:cytoskeletal protein CcmA (bactofilin family)